MRNIVLAIAIALAASATIYLLATGLSEATGLNRWNGAWWGYPSASPYNDQAQIAAGSTIGQWV